MSISDSITRVFNAAESSRIKLEDFGIKDEDDLVVFALNFLLANFDGAFDVDSLETESWNPDEESDYGDTETPWDFSLEDIERIIQKRDED